MYLWKLARVNVVTPSRDTLRSVVVAAETEAQARQLATAVAGDEGRAAWTEGNQTACIHIGDAEPTAFPYPGIVCADFLEG